MHQYTGLTTARTGNDQGITYRRRDSIALWLVQAFKYVSDVQMRAPFLSP